MSEPTKEFFEHGPFAVVGASTNREKYGNKILRCYLQHEKEVYPINPRAEQIEGVSCFPALDATPQKPGAISIITPPKITEQVVETAAQLGIEWVWMQPGAESPEAVRKAKELGLHVIAGGPCVLVVLGYDDSWVGEA
jgi:predicted CoA-binding protein